MAAKKAAAKKAAAKKAKPATNEPARQVEFEVEQVETPTSAIPSGDERPPVEFVRTRQRKG